MGRDEEGHGGGSWVEVERTRGAPGRWKGSRRRRVCKWGLRIIACWRQSLRPLSGGVRSACKGQKLFPRSPKFSYPNPRRLPDIAGGGAVAKRGGGGAAGGGAQAATGSGEPRAAKRRRGSRERGGGAMSKRLVSRMLGMFQSRTQVGVDKAGNRYFTRVEEVDGVMKEKRWVEFKGDQEPSTVPVEWICWLNGQRKKAPTPEELADMEARRERVKQNVELLKKKEEEERRVGVRPVKTVGKAESPNLKSFMQQFPGTSLDEKKGPEDLSRPKDATDTGDATTDNERSSEPTGSGATFKPGTWQPPA